MARVLIIDDTLAFAQAAMQVLHSAEAQAAGVDPRSLQISDHAGFLAEPARWGSVDVALVDAYDDHTQRVDLGASRFAALDVADTLASLPSPPRLVVYSLDIAHPEVSVPTSQLPRLHACYGADELLADLVGIVGQGSLLRRARPPSAEDFAVLGVGPHARVVDALRLLRSREEAWVAVWSPEWTAPSKATRDWIRDRVVPLLDLPRPGYRMAIRVAQRICWLPARRP